MSGRTPAQLIDVNAANVAETGFFCLRSRRTSAGFQRKLAWLEARFAEGMRIKLLGGGARGFIEYLPGEYAWRAIEAPGYMVIHCLWVVGQSKGKGYGSALLEQCVADARAAGMQGVATVASSGNWLAGRKILLRSGFEVVDRAPPAFELLVRRFAGGPAPAFPKDWDERLRRQGDGMTVFRTDQCPYIDDATEAALMAGAAHGLATRVVELRSATETRRLAPSAYGVFGVVCDGRLVTYHPLNQKALLERLVKLGYRA